MVEQTTPADLSGFSDQLVGAVEAAAAWTVGVRARRGLGASGIAIAPDLVLTADHVVDPARENEIRIGLPDGNQAAARLVGRDPASDLAVLRVSGAQLTPARAAPTEPRIGALALIVARPHRDPAAGLALISGLGGPARTRRGGLLERFIQVDAIMYPGFSGGPLIDTRGAALGLATSGIAFEGPAVVIPWAVASSLAGLIAAHGKVPRGYLGIGTQPVALSPAARDLSGGQERGLLVVHVVEGGPAAQAGLLQGDILVRLEGTSTPSADDLQAILGPSRVGATVTAAVVRGGELREVAVRVGARD